MFDSGRFTGLGVVLLACMIASSQCGCFGGPQEGQTLSEARGGDVSASPEERAAVDEHLSKLKYSVDDLGIRTSSVPTAERLKAVEGLGSLRGMTPEVIMALTEVKTNDPSVVVRRAAAAALGQGQARWGGQRDGEVFEAFWDLIGVPVVDD